MSPLQWEILFLFSLVAIAFVTAKFFFSFLSPPQNSASKMESNKLINFNWLW